MHHLSMQSLTPHPPLPARTTWINKQKLLLIAEVLFASYSPNASFFLQLHSALHLGEYCTRQRAWNWPNSLLGEFNTLSPLSTRDKACITLHCSTDARCVLASWLAGSGTHEQPGLSELLPEWSTIRCCSIALLTSTDKDAGGGNQVNTLRNLLIDAGWA